MSTQHPVLMSHSEVDTYLVCERRHYYSHGDLLQRKQQSDALYRGILGHSAMERFYRAILDGADSNEALKAALTVVQAEVMKPEPRFEVLNELTRMITGYIERWIDDPIKPLYIEEEFRLKVDEDFTYPFKVDLVGEAKKGLACIDFKFVYDFFNDDELALMPQIPKYIAALRAMDIPVKYGFYDQLRYRKMKDPSPFQLYRRDEVHPSNARIRQTFLEQIEAARRVRERKMLPLEVWKAKSLRTANKMVCRSCSFKDLCIAELNGSDGELIRKLEFEPNTYGYSESNDA